MYEIGTWYPIKRGRVPCVMRLIGEYIYETLTKLGPTYLYSFLRPRHPTGRRSSMYQLLETLVFQQWCPPHVGQAKLTMARKRAASAMASRDPAPRGRLRCRACSTYATTAERPSHGRTNGRRPASGFRRSAAPDPTPEQELQQLQAQLQAMLQERDRVIAAFIASQ